MLDFFIATILFSSFLVYEYFEDKWNKKYTERIISENKEYKEVIPLVYMKMIYRNIAILVFYIAVSIIFSVEASIITLFVLLFIISIFYPKILKRKSKH